MSWDVFVQDLPANIRSVTDIPDTFTPQPLCKRSDLVQRIRRFAPRTRFDDASWGTFETPSFSVEFNLGADDHVRSFALHVRGDTTAAAFVAELLQHLGYRALDPQSPSGLFEAGAVAEASMRRWQEYRNQIIP